MAFTNRDVDRARTVDDLLSRRELDALAADGSGFEVFYTVTRGAPAGWSGFARRIDVPMLAQVAKPFGLEPLVFICGPTLMVENAASGLTELGIPAARIKTGRFGPSGS